MTGKSDRKKTITEIIESLHEMIRGLDTFSRKTLRDYGVTGPQLWALRTMKDAESLTVTELAERMFLHISTVSSILDRLEERKLVVREKDRGDRRVTRLQLTHAGVQLLSNSPEAPRGKLPAGLQQLSEGDLAAMLRSLNRLAEIMEISRYAADSPDTKIAQKPR